jgi:DNA-binding LacI/PurR family transcriptional regulator
VLQSKEIAKHREVYEHIHRAIVGGEFGVGQQIPTELELSASFNVSRPTISRALRDLEQQGYLVRRRGAGTFVREFRQAARGLFGLTVPQSEGGILGPICAEIVQRADQIGHGVLFGVGMPRQPGAVPKQIDDFCERFISHKVAGVFFLPLMVAPDEMDVNRRIAERLTAAGIAIVLLDHDIYDFPQRSQYDLIGVDNRRNGYMVTEHLLQLGCRRIEFVSIDLAVSTATARIAGYCDALRMYGLEPDPAWIHHWNTATDPAFVRRLVQNGCPDAYVCLNDDIARLMMLHLATLGVQVPQAVRIVGFDDLPYAASLPVPLTTMHQPTRDIGSVAVETLVSRLAVPRLPARDVSLACELLVRESSGVAVERETTGRRSLRQR